MPTKEGPYSSTKSKDPIRHSKEVDNAGNPVQKKYNLNLDKILDEDPRMGPLPRDAR